MNKVYILHKLSKTLSFLNKIKRWQLVLYIFILAELMALTLNFTQSYIWWGYINIDLLYIGTVDAAIIVAILGPVFILLASQITRLEDYKKEVLEQSKVEQKYRRFIENSLDVVTVLDKKGFVKYMSPSGEKLLGYKPTDLIGKSGFDFIHPDDMEKVFKLFKEMIGQYNSSASIELRLLKDGGGWVNLAVSGRNLLHDELVEGIVLNSKDISELKESQLKLSQLLEEKEILIREIHHRVKNNFQSVTAMLSLQAEMLTDEGLKEILNVTRNRVHSLAIIHEKLQDSEDVSKINLSLYFHRLLENIELSYKNSKRDIKIELKLDESIELPTNYSVQLGLIINELVSNVYKYAFPNNRDGIINISFECTKGMNCLIVKDNGVGLPENFDLSESKSLGLKIVELITKQINGQLSIKTKEGTEFIVKFPEVKK